MDFKDTIQKLKNDPRAVQSVMQSQDGQQLMQMLTASDGGAALNNAAQQAASGNTEAITQLLKSVLNSPQGAELAQRINQSLQK